MADLKITGLDPLAEGSIQSTDVLAIADISATETKKVTVKDLVAAAAQFLDAGDIPAAKVGSGISAGSLADGSVTNVKLANDSVSFGGVSVDLGAADATPAFNLSDATAYPTSSLVGTITNAQLAGSIANAKLANSSVSLGGITVALGASDATPAFDLTDATNYKTTNLVGTITNAQLAGSIDVSKLVGSNINFGGVTVALGGSDTTPAFNLSDATNYPTSALVGTITNAQLAGSIANTKLVANSITANELAANSVTDSELANLSVATGSVQDGAITNDKVETSTSATTGLDGATKIRDATITPAKLNTSNLDRSINVASGNLGINNAVSGGASTKSGISYNAQGLITGTVDLAAGDLPIATTSAVGGVSIASAGGLAVTGAGALSIAATITGSTATKVTFNGFGQITDTATLAAGDLPVATASAIGGVSIPTGGPLTVDGNGAVTVADSGVQAGTNTKVTVDAKGRVTALADLADSDLPPHSAALLTSGTINAARIGTDSIDGTKLSNSSTTIIQSIAQLGYPTALFTGQLLFDPIAEDAYLWDGNAWNPITTLTKGALVRLGTYNANLSQVDYVTAAGSAAGLTVGQNLPVASDSVDGGYVVISVQGTPSGVAGITGQLSPPDYLLGVTASATSSSWVEIDLSTTVASQQASAISYTPHGQLSSTNVQAVINEIEDEKLAKAGGTVTGEVLISNTGSLVFEGSTVDAFETTLTVADPTTSDKTITLPNVTGTVITTGDAGTVTGTMLANDTIQNVDIKSDAAIAFTKLADLTSAQIIVGNGSNKATSVAVTGDIAITNAGVTSIAAGVIVDADINSSAAISGSKIVAGTTSVVGVLQLTNAADSTSTTTAATPAAVKTAKDAADAAATTANAALPTTGGVLTGNLTLDDEKELRFREEDAGGDHYIALKAAAALAADVTLTLPAVAPTAGQVLKANASTPTTLEWGTDSATDSSKMPLTGGEFTGDVTFKGDASDVVWDKSASAFTGTITATALSGPLTGTIQTAAQANITSLGTLTSLGISGNLTVDTNTLHVDATNNRVLIGRTTTNTGYPLCVEGDSNGENILVIGRSADDISEIGFFENDTTTRLGEIQYRQDHVNFRHRVGDICFAAGGSTEMMRLDSSGRLLVGTNATTGASFGSTPLAIFESSTTNDYGRLGLIYNGDDQHASAITFGKSRGTSDGSNTVVQDDDQIGSLFFQGADGTDKESRAAAIMAFVDGTPGSNDMPGRLTFLTTADGAAGTTERMRITSNGQVWIGDDASWGPNSNADDLIVGNRTSGIHNGITILSHTSSSSSLHFADTAHDSAGVIKYDHNVGSMQFATETSTALTINSSQAATFAGTVSDSKGDLRSIPKLIKSSNHILVASDAGKCVFVNAAANVTVNNGVLTLGDAVTIVNHHSAGITIIQDSGMTMYNSATTNTGDKTLASRGMATIWFAADDTAYISGSGLSDAS